MKIRIHLLGNINLICDHVSLEKLASFADKLAKKGELMEVPFEGFSSKFINPIHIVAIEEFIETAAPPVQTVDVQA